MALQIGSELTCSMGVRDMTASIAWYERVLLCKLLYRADEIGWCELATPMQGVNIGLSEVESVTQGGGATNVFEVPISWRRRCTSMPRACDRTATSSIFRAWSGC